MAHPTEEGSRSDSEKDTSNSDATLAFDRLGRGEPMVLLRHRASVDRFAASSRGGSRVAPTSLHR